MLMRLDDLAGGLLFWSGWIIIPLFMEILPAVFRFFCLFRSVPTAEKETLQKLPEITLIIPVYNSDKTLDRCLKSVAYSSYPKSLMKVMLVNNESSDRSFDVYSQVKREFPELRLQWLNSAQGKSKALNMALYNSSGKYVIHVDSDGMLLSDALYNLVRKFESSPDIICLTGVVLTNPEQAETSKGFLKILRRLEFLEYVQNFLAGRNYESRHNRIYTIAGAFSAFRRSALKEIELYSSDTVCEDTHITFQLRKRYRKGIEMCEDAFFITDGIDGLDQLYTQRQRWQRGELEIANEFCDMKQGLFRGFCRDFVYRLLVLDHTFSFPRMIWCPLIICLIFLDYPVKFIFGSLFLIYVLYVLCGYLRFLIGIRYLNQQTYLRKYCVHIWFLVTLLPFWNTAQFLVRMIGIINSVYDKQVWKGKPLIKELSSVKKMIASDLSKPISIFKRIRRILNER